MFCPKCGSQQPDNARFCGVCGTTLSGGDATHAAHAAGAARPAPGARVAGAGGYAAGPNVAGGMATVRKNAALISLVAAVLVLLVVFLLPTADSPFYATMMRASEKQAEEYDYEIDDEVPRSIEMGIVDFAGMGTGVSALQGLSSMGSSAPEGLDDAAGALAFVRVLLMAWVVVAALVGICAVKFKESAPDLMRFLLLTLAVEAVLCIVWFFVVGAASGALTDLVGGEDVVEAAREGLEQMDMSGNLSMLGVSLWGWLALVLSVLGGLVAFVKRD